MRVLLIDRSNHHVFQPLLYQVATSVLSPGKIGSSIRGIVTEHENTSVMLGTVTIAKQPEKFVIGDTASLEQDGCTLSGVAQVAMQQGAYAAKARPV